MFKICSEEMARPLDGFLCLNVIEIGFASAGGIQWRLNEPVRGQRSTGPLCCTWEFLGSNRNCPSQPPVLMRARVPLGAVRRGLLGLPLVRNLWGDVWVWPCTGAGASALCVAEYVPVAKLNPGPNFSEIWNVLRYRFLVWSALETGQQWKGGGQ